MISYQTVKIKMMDNKIHAVNATDCIDALRYKHTYTGSGDTCREEGTFVEFPFERRASCWQTADKQRRI